MDFVEPPATGPIVGYTHESVARIMRRRRRTAQSGRFADGMSLYSYCQNSPTNYVDPSGLKRVETGVKRCSGYKKGGLLFSWFPIHGFVAIDGVGYGFFEKNLNVWGSGDVRDNDLTIYPEGKPNEDGFYSKCSPVILDDECHDPVLYKQKVLEFIAGRTAVPGSYCAGVRDCNAFVGDALQDAFRSSYKPNAPCSCFLTTANPMQ